MARSPSNVPEPSAGPSLWERAQEVLTAAALLFSIIGGGALAVGGGVYLWVPELRGFGNSVMLVGLALLLVALASSFVPVRKALTGQRGRYAANALVMVVALVAIVSIVNFLTFRATLRADVTASRQFSLSEQTIRVLGNLDQPVHATAFFVPGLPDQIATRQRAEDLMFEYRNRSGGKFSYEFIDPEADPSIARELQVTDYPTILFRATDTNVAFELPLPPMAEQDLTTALLIVTGTEQKMIYFLDGHGEKDSARVETEVEAFGMAAGGLLRDSYGIRTVNLSRSGVVPSDAAVLVIAGPKTDLTFAEHQVLMVWLRNGGRALFLLDPDPPESFLSLLAPWGIEVGKGTIVDQGSSLLGDPRSPLLQRSQYMPDIPITRLLDATLFPEAGAVRIAVEEKKRPPWIQYVPLAASSVLSWTTEDPERNEYDGALGDVGGPHFLAIAVRALSTVEEEPEGFNVESNPLEARETPVATSIVVFGDSDFAANAYYSYSTNKDFLLNAVNWLAQDFDLIAIRPKAFAFRNLVVTSSEFDFIRYTSWFILPSAVALMGLVIWWRRR